MVKWVAGNVVQVKHWTDSLFSLIIHAPIAPFTAGQFAKIRLEINGKNIQRAYSYVNAPKNNNLEFYLVTVPEGKISSLLHRLQPGDNLMVSKEAAGVFVLDEIPPCDNLWMLATGTALGPYLSILEQGEGLVRFNKIVLVHAVRFSRDLSYLSQLLDLQQRFRGKLRCQTVISREKALGSLTGRVPTLIADGSLEAAVGVKLEKANSHVMLCGNPKMVHDTQKLLKDTRGMQKHFKRKPGHMTSEHYW
ncbi:ferredoxin--NADP(+) reductase [Candidatus Doolittlea endobia]|uniref:Flavodoxin/ferredoxin--NADP reductase n=1 Tax=Candidatus Doolittlea endobia TaxID=1778262 RepID=A0A143WS60_9ENTR|nr:ferredoxin--NADP(+) reductase [Candidatus Doolittlea endobia]CUX96656.1 Ferredoxin--NADP reductase [Candidatus Doolittlea endobia]